MGKERNGPWKWIAKILAACVILFVGWFGNQVWSKQEVTSQTNTEQDVSIVVLQKNIIAVEKVVLRMDSCLADDRINRRKQDSILMDVAIKVNLMFDGR